MSASAERGRVPWRMLARASTLLAPILLGLALLAFVLCGGARAQEVADGGAFFNELNSTVAATELILKTGNADSASLEHLRETLLEMRGEALAAQKKANAGVEEAKSRLEALGPAPADGAVEPEELADRRRQAQQAVADAQLPVLRAQEANATIDRLVRALDGEIFRRLSDDLRSVGPSPLAPANWVATAELLRMKIGASRDSAAALTSDERTRMAVSKRLPRSLGLLAFGLAVTLFLRYRLTAWTENELGRATSPRAIAWLVALRNLSRLLLPAVGAGFLFAALDPALLSGSETFRFFNLPPFVLVLIGAGWLANSVFSPQLPQYRLVPLDDRQARRGARLSHLLGAVLAGHFLIVNHLGDWELTLAADAVIHFPLTLLGGYGMWRMSRLYRGAQRNMAQARANLPEQQVSKLGQNLLATMERVVWLIGLGTPLLAALGFYVAAQVILYPMILTLGLFGANLVLFDLIGKTAASVLATPKEGGAPAGAPNGGLGPVILVTLLLIVSAPLLALIWGARPSDIASFWLLVREGGSFWGMHISGAMVVSFIFVFALLLGLTRLAQSLLAGSVLPRTRLDTGGKNAILSGVGYVGYTLAGVAAVSVTGIDLSSIAIVAGALSVGIGFGLQTIVSNFVSGIILLIERPVKEGDWIEVSGFIGHVRRISVRSTEIETFDRASVILPNSDLISGTVLNRTHSGMTGRIQVPVSVAYDSDPRKVSELLMSAAEMHPLVLTDPSPRVLLMNLGPDTMDFEIRCVLRDVNFSLSVRSDLNFEVIARLNAAGIRVRYWGRDVPPPPDPKPDPEAEPKPA